MMLSAVVLAFQVQSLPLLALETEAGEIYVSSPDGKSVVRIADGQRPVWSPDGTKIAFGVPSSAGDDPTVDLFVITPDGMAKHKVASKVQADGYEWKWSPDSKSLLFVTKVNKGFDQAWMASLSEQPRKLGPVCSGEFEYATFSPRSNQVMLWQAVGKWTPGDLDDGKHHHEIVSYGLASKPKSLGQGVDSKFSPDGKWLAFDRDGTLMIAGADASNLKPRAKMESDEAGYSSFNWLPDSSGIVFVEGKTRDLVVMRPNGTGKRRLVAKADAGWVSPNGSKALAFTDSGMILVDVATGKNTRVYDDIDFVPIGWSSDGSRLYFSSFTEAGTIVRWHRPDGKIGGEFKANRATFDVDPLSPRGNVLVGSGDKGLTLFQANGTPVRILADQRVVRYSWSSR